MLHEKTDRGVIKFLEKSGNDSLIRRAMSLRNRLLEHDIRLSIPGIHRIWCGQLASTSSWLALKEGKTARQ